MDTIQHYAGCPQVARLARARLRVAEVPFEDRLEDFLFLRGHLELSQLALGALRLYATFIATNAARHGRVTDASDAWVQAMTAAAGMDTPLRRIVATLWSPSPTTL